MQQPQPSSKGITKATPSLAECIEGLPLELQREIMSYFLPRFSGRKMFPWPTACSGSVIYDSFTIGLAPRILSRAICDDFEEEVSKCLRNKPITMTMKIKREGPLHPTSRLLPRFCQPDYVLSVQRRRAIFCVKTGWGLLLAMLLDLAATRRNRVYSKFSFDVKAGTKILQDVKDIVMLQFLHYPYGAPGAFPQVSWKFLREFLVSTYPQFVAHGTVQLHLMVPDWNTYSTRHLCAFLQDVRCFTENGLLSLRVLVSTQGKGSGRWAKELQKIASAVEWVKDTS